MGDFLDHIGLSYLWNKIKAYIANNSSKVEIVSWTTEDLQEG